MVRDRVIRGLAFNDFFLFASITQLSQHNGMLCPFVKRLENYGKFIGEIYWQHLWSSSNNALQLSPACISDLPL